MKLGLYTIGDRYSFSVDEFSSHDHFYLTADIKSSYKYAWQAYSAARQLAFTTPSHIEAVKKYAVQDMTKEETLEISAEEMVSQHYDSIFNIIEERSKGEIESDKKDVIYGEIKQIVEEILKVIEQIEDEKSKTALKEIISKFRVLVRERFPKHLQEDIAEENKLKDIQDAPPQEQYDPATPTEQVSKTSKSNQIIKEASVIDFTILEEYAKNICKAIERKHPDSIYTIAKDNSILIKNANNGLDLLKIQTDKELNISGIYPIGSVSEIYPYNSKEFYQRYWKPIVESVGHYAINDEIIYGKLPDIPENNKEFKVNSSKENMFLKFSTNIWELQAKPIDAAAETVAPKLPKEYTESDIKQDTMVECIVPELKSIFGKKGLVKQVIPLGSHIELDVEFLEKERGIKRLTTDQIKIVNV